MALNRRAFIWSAGAAAGWSRAAFGYAVTPRPKLLVLVIAEEFRTDYLDSRASSFAPGGFRRLMEEGAYFPNCRLSSSGFTASGIVTIAAGAYPSVHGIVADRWFDRSGQEPVTASAKLLQATTLADQFASTDGRNRLYGVGLHPRSAELLTGLAGARLIAMNDAGEWTSFGSDGAEPGYPGWIGQLRDTYAPEKSRGWKWFPMAARPPETPMRVLAYDPAKPREFISLLQASPVGQASQFGLLRELIVQDKLGHGPGLDFAGIALGSMSTLAYEVGGDSPLVLDLVSHLDRQMETLLDFLKQRVGEGNFQLVFTAAHGAPPLPDPEHRAQMAVPGEPMARLVNEALSVRYDDPAAARNNYVDKYIYPFLYLRLEQLRKVKANVREARELAGMAAMHSGKVNAYYTADGDCSHSGEWKRRMTNSFHTERSGDVMVSYPPNYVEDYGPGRGISYGSIYNYDTRVPLIFYGSQYRPHTSEIDVESVDIAPTLAGAMGLPLPSSSTGHVLGAAFK